MIGRTTEAPTYKNTCTKNKTNRDQLKYDIGVPIPNAIPFTPKKNGPKYSSKKLGTGGFWPIPKGANWAQPPLISLTTHHIKSNLSRNLKSCSWNHINHPRKRKVKHMWASQPMAKRTGSGVGSIPNFAVRNKNTWAMYSLVVSTHTPTKAPVKLVHPKLGLNNTDH